MFNGRTFRKVGSCPSSQNSATALSKVYMKHLVDLKKSLDGDDLDKDKINRLCLTFSGSAGWGYDDFEEVQALLSRRGMI